MWKIAVGFIALAAVALWLLSKSGDVNMGGDEHGGAAAHAPDAAASAPAPVPSATASATAAMPASASASAGK